MMWTGLAMMMSPATRRIGLAVVSLLVLAMGSLTLIERFAVAEDVRADRQPTSPCSAVITETLSDHPVPVCEPVTLTSSLAASCPNCAGGLNIVFVQVELAPEAGWMNSVSVDALSTLQDVPGVAPNVGVVHYTDRAARIALPMTDELDRARAPLRRPSDSGHITTGVFEDAVRLALGMIEDARRGNGGRPIDASCDYVVLFAYVKEHNDRGRAALLNAARAVRGSGATLLLGCPADPGDPALCKVERQAVQSLRFYSEPNDRSLPRVLSELVDDALGERALQTVTLVHRFPAGLAFVDGSSSRPPDNVSRIGDSTAGDVDLDESWRHRPSHGIAGRCAGRRGDVDDRGRSRNRRQPKRPSPPFISDDALDGHSSVLLRVAYGDAERDGHIRTTDANADTVAAGVGDGHDDTDAGGASSSTPAQRTLYTTARSDRCRASDRRFDQHARAHAVQPLQAGCRHVRGTHVRQPTRSCRRGSSSRRVVQRRR